MLQNAKESVVVLSIKDTPSAEREGADAKQAGRRLLQAGAYSFGTPSRGSDAAAAAQALNPGASTQGAACDWLLLLHAPPFWPFLLPQSDQCPCTVYCRLTLTQSCIGHDAVHHLQKLKTTRNLGISGDAQCDRAEAVLQVQGRSLL